MRRILPGLVLLAAVCIGAAPVEAREVVEFVDGRYLEIRSYVAQGDLIRLDVDRDSFMVIPVANVDEIRRDRDVVFSQGRAVLSEPRTAGATRRHETTDREHRETSPVAEGAVIVGS